MLYLKQVKLKYICFPAQIFFVPESENLFRCRSAPLVFSTWTKSAMDFFDFGVFIDVRRFRISQEKHLSLGFQKNNPQKTKFSILKLAC